MVGENNMYKCCNKPNYIRAYTPCKPFKAKYCLNCDEVIGDMSEWAETIWKYTIGLFWNGAVLICEDEKL